jgi:hypothetical protein
MLDGNCDNHQSLGYARKLDLPAVRETAACHVLAAR